eukprot:g62188.t1
MTEVQHSISLKISCRKLYLLHLTNFTEIDALGSIHSVIRSMTTLTLSKMMTMMLHFHRLSYISTVQLNYFSNVQKNVQMDYAPVPPSSTEEVPAT